MRISLIVAMTHDRVIGRGGRLPWHLPVDLKHFKTLTMGKPIIMGRRTFESLPRILPGRRHIVISRQRDYRIAGAEVVASLDSALDATADAPEVCVIGGAEIFREVLPCADRIYLTLVDAEVRGDVHFPAFDPNAWREVERRQSSADAYPLTFLTLERRSS